MHDSDVLGGIIGLVVLIGIFLLCREIICWYWKLNKIVYFQEYQVNLLKLIHKELKKLNATGDRVEDVEPSDPKDIPQGAPNP
jgi:hypothetical protein